MLQPSCSISARDMGRTGATPKRCAQYFRRANRVGGNRLGEAICQREEAGGAIGCRHETAALPMNLSDPEAKCGSNPLYLSLLRVDTDCSQ
jgi:hypothetical protein